MTRKSAPRRGSMVRNAVHLGLGQVATTILTILVSATMGRTLGPADFGVLYLVTSIATFAFVIVDWGHGVFIVREAARFPEKAGDLLGSALALRAVGALFACALAVVTTWLLGYDERTCVLTGAMILGLLPQYLGLSFGWIFRSRERMDRDAVLNVVLKFATLIGVVVCLALGGRLFGLIVTYAIAGCLTFAVGITTYKGLGLPAISATLSTARELMHAGASLFAMSLAVAVEPYFNANILYKMASPEVVGWYGAAWNIAGTLIAPATIVAATMYPRLSAAASDATEFKRAFDVAFRPLLLLAVLGAVGTFLFADVAVGLIYSLQKFGPATDTLRAFAPVLLLMYVDLFLAMVIVSAGRAGQLARFKVASVVLTTGLVFALIPFCQTRFGNGGLGVMYAMIIGELLMLIAAGSLVREVIDRAVLAMVCRCLAAGAATVVLFRILPALSPFLSIPMCVLAFGGLSLLAGAVERTDVEMLVKPLRKQSPVAVDGEVSVSAVNPSVSTSVDTSTDRSV